MRFQTGYVCHAPAQYIYGCRPSDGVHQAEDLSSGEVAAFLMANPWVTTRSATIQRALAFITTFAPR